MPGTFRTSGRHSNIVPLPLHLSSMVIGLLPGYTHVPQTNSFILWFTSLSRIRPDLRLIFALAAGLETCRLDSRPLPQSRPDERMAEENRWQLHKTHRPLETKDPHRRKFSRSLRSRLSSWA